MQCVLTDTHEAMQRGSSYWYALQLQQRDAATLQLSVALSSHDIDHCCAVFFQVWVCAVQLCVLVSRVMLCAAAVSVGAARHIER